MSTNHDPLEDVRAYMKSRVLLTAAELDLFTRIHEKPSSKEQLAQALNVDLRALTRILDCLAAFGYLDKSDGVYRITELGEPFSSAHPESVLPLVLHLNHIWDNWTHLTETVRKGSNPERRSVVDSGSEVLEAFINAMHVVGRNLAREIAASLDLSKYRCLLDVGGGSGTYTLAFLEKNPSLQAVLFDLPDVIPLARKRLSQQGLENRVRLVPGDFYKDPLPKGCDLALLSAIIHQNSPEENRQLYRKIREVLEPGGALLIRDHIMDSDRTHPPGGALFAINMLVNTPGGDTYTFEEVKDDLTAAGFSRVEWIRKGERMDDLILAQLP